MDKPLVTDEEREHVDGLVAALTRLRDAIDEVIRDGSEEDQIDVARQLAQMFRPTEET